MNAPRAFAAPVAFLAARFGLDRGRALANASPDPVRRARERHEQYRSIIARTGAQQPRPDPADGSDGDGATGSGAS